MKREWVAQISNTGHLPAKESREIADFIRGLPGKRLKIALAAQDRIRTPPQNKFYQGPFIDALSQKLLDHGYRIDHEDIHGALRDKYAKNGFSLILPGDVEFKIPPSTRRLSTPQFSDFLEEIRADYAQRVGWQLPLPNEVPLGAYED